MGLRVFDRIPFLARYPPVIPAGSVRSQMALNIDVAPTVLELAGAKPFGPVHGRSLVPVMKSASAPLCDSFPSEYFVEKAAANVPDWQCVRTNRWKYIQYPEIDGMDELYDLSTDLKEERNLIHDPARKDTVEEIEAGAKEFDAASDNAGGVITSACGVSRSSPCGAESVG